MAAIGSVTLEVILKPKGMDGDGHVVGEVTIPISITKVAPTGVIVNGPVTSKVDSDALAKRIERGLKAMSEAD